MRVSCFLAHLYSSKSSFLQTDLVRLLILCNFNSVLFLNTGFVPKTMRRGFFHLFIDTICTKVVKTISFYANVPLPRAEGTLKLFGGKVLIILEALSRYSSCCRRCRSAYLSTSFLDGGTNRNLAAVISLDDSINICLQLNGQSVFSNFRTRST